jgi:hypothetical protein
MRCDGSSDDLFLILDGKKIAKRGTPQAKQWIALEPGYTVQMTETDIVVEYNGVRLH